MAKTSDVVITVFKSDWEEFAEHNKHNPYVKCADVISYALTNIINVRWDYIKWYTKDDYIDAITEFFKNRSYILTTLDDDNTVCQEDNVIDDDELSDFWDYAPQVKLVV